MNNPHRLPLLRRDEIDFERWSQEMAPIAKVLPPSNWRDELVDLVRNGSQIRGATLPWSKTHDRLRFRGGEVTLWMGINGHGKSQLLGQACLWFAAQRESVCVASFEMRPVATLHRMLRQAAQVSNPSEKFADEMLGRLENRFWLYDQMGECSPEMVYGLIRFCSLELGIKHIVIDSLMKVVQGEDRYNEQKDFVAKLCNLARDLDIHIHLVHHVRKGASENDVPGKFDSKGTGAVSDLVDQILVVWRNKRKEKQLAQMLITGRVDQKVADEYDALLAVEKNRHDGNEKAYALWFHSPSLQYTSDSRCIPLDLMGANR